MVTEDRTQQFIHYKTKEFHSGGDGTKSSGVLRRRVVEVLRESRLLFRSKHILITKDYEYEEENACCCVHYLKMA